MDDPRRPQRQASIKRRSQVIFALGMSVLLVVFWIGGDNGVVYVASLLGVPIVSGVLAGLHVIRYWLAALACLAVVALDVVFDETPAEDAVFFAVLAVVMIGIAALALGVTRQILRRRGGRPEGASN
jgi:hypothetical protein